METADSHWVDLEQQYKEREEAYRAKEASLKQKITQLQDCLRDDSRAATEKIQQLEEGEQALKTCLVRMTKEHRDLLTENQTLQCSMESVMARICWSSPPSSWRIGTSAACNNCCSASSNSTWMPWCQAIRCVKPQYLWIN